MIMLYIMIKAIWFDAHADHTANYVYDDVEALDGYTSYTGIYGC